MICWKESCLRRILKGRGKVVFKDVQSIRNWTTYPLASETSFSGFALDAFGGDIGKQGRVLRVECVGEADRREYCVC